MEDYLEKLVELNKKLHHLSRKQDSFAEDIVKLKGEIQKLHFEISGKGEPTKQETKKVESVANVVKEPILVQKSETEIRSPQKVRTAPLKKFKSLNKSNLEKFIGENLINKIGILITIIGVVIGAKYSIENNLISPLTRIVLGYLTGIGLLAVGIKLKEKYLNFSAVLVSGAMVIFYFITFAAYSFYDLFPQFMAFSLMVVFTAFTVLAALKYNTSIIAHLGLVGAYAIPFMLSNDSGSFEILFSYVAIINIGILIVSFKKYWKSIYYSSFLITWLIYVSWYFSSYKTEDIQLALIFLTVLFLIFYITSLAYKLIKKEKFEIGDVLLLMGNSFIFYGMGIVLLSENETGEQLLGIFTVANALLHFIVSTIIYKQKLADRNLFFLIAGLVLVFLTIAVPVQLDGNWVTILWAGEAALLFWIGRTKRVPVYEKLSYIVMALAFISLIQDWLDFSTYVVAGTESTFTPILNLRVLTSVLFLLAFGFIMYIFQNTKYVSPFSKENIFQKLLSLGIPAIFLFVLYYFLRLEIADYWNGKYLASYLEINELNDSYTNYYENRDYQDFRIVWIYIYTLLFLAVASFINIKKIKNDVFGYVLIIGSAFTFLAFFTEGVYALTSLRESYLNQELSKYYDIGVFNLLIRYIAIAAVLALVFVGHLSTRTGLMKKGLQKAFTILIHIIVIAILSTELVAWMDIAGSTNSYKLGLSILWGIYSLFLIVVGIWKNKPALRIFAIVLFSFTLIKLFLYDISDLNTISKTIVFVILGLLLLVISFLYNKFKNKISDEN